MDGLKSICRDSGGVSPTRVVRAVALGALGVLLIIVVLNAVLRSRRTELPGPAPPDLSRCTRIEIRQAPMTLGYPVWKTEMEKNLLTPEEVRDIEALLEFAVDAPEDIKAFAQTIASGSYGGQQQAGYYRTKMVAEVLCHFDDGPPLRLTVYGASSLVTKDKQVFKYKTPLTLSDRISSQVVSSELLPQIRLRIGCARHLRQLYTGLRGFQDDVAYPPAPGWCDIVVRRSLDQGDTEKETLGRFCCPAVLTGRCHYAMNANCAPDSLADTVLLFETEPGWNQHGGPELFTFNNHEPRGGCVLLSDGTVKFIRTEAELHALRWE